MGEEFVNQSNGNKVPRNYGVPVTTIVGYYDPDINRNLESYIYPAMHGAYGFVYDDEGDSGNNDNGCKLVVQTKLEPLVYSLSSSALSSNVMNKFHINVATEDEPNEASIYCANELLISRGLDWPKEDQAPLEYTVTGNPLTSNPTPLPTSPPTPSPIVSPPLPTTVSPTRTPTHYPTRTPTHYPTQKQPTPYPTHTPPTPHPTGKAPTPWPTRIEKATPWPTQKAPTPWPTQKAPTPWPTHTPPTPYPTGTAP